MDHNVPFDPALNHPSIDPATSGPDLTLTHQLDQSLLNPAVDPMHAAHSDPAAFPAGVDPAQHPLPFAPGLPDITVDPATLPALPDHTAHIAANDLLPPPAAPDPAMLMPPPGSPEMHWAPYVPEDRNTAHEAGTWDTDPPPHVSPDATAFPEGSFLPPPEAEGPATDAPAPIQFGPADAVLNVPGGDAPPVSPPGVDPLPDGYIAPPGNPDSPWGPYLPEDRNKHEAGRWDTEPIPHGAPQEAGPPPVQDDSVLPAPEPESREGAADAENSVDAPFVSRLDGTARQTVEFSPRGNPDWPWGGYTRGEERNTRVEADGWDTGAIPHAAREAAAPPALDGADLPAPETESADGAAGAKNPIEPRPTEDTLNAIVGDGPLGSPPEASATPPEYIAPPGTSELWAVQEGNFIPPPETDGVPSAPDAVALRPNEPTTAPGDAALPVPPLPAAPVDAGAAPTGGEHNVQGDEYAPYRAAADRIQPPPILRTDAGWRPLINVDDKAIAGTDPPVSVRDRMRYNAQQAIEARDYADAAVILNGFNRSDMDAVLRSQRTSDLVKIRDAALAFMPGFSDRVVESVEQAVAAAQKAESIQRSHQAFNNAVLIGNWKDAALLLNGFSDFDIAMMLRPLAFSAIEKIAAAAPDWTYRVEQIATAMTTRPAPARIAKHGAPVQAGPTLLIAGMGAPSLIPEKPPTVENPLNAPGLDVGRAEAPGFGRELKWRIRYGPGTPQVPAQAPGAGTGAPMVEPLAPGASAEVRLASALGRIVAVGEATVAVVGVPLVFGALIMSDMDPKRRTQVVVVEDMRKLVEEENRRMSDALRQQDFGLIKEKAPGLYDAAEKLSHDDIWVAVALLKLAYGIALEKHVADAVRQSQFLSQYLDYVAGPNRADFYGKKTTVMGGLNFDITTFRDAERHKDPEKRPRYGENLIVIGFKPPWVEDKW